MPAGSAGTSCSSSCAASSRPAARASCRSALRTSITSILRIPSSEDAGDEVEHVGGADLAVPVGLDHPVLDDVDLLLRVLVHHAGDQVLQLDAVLLVLEELQLQRLVQPLGGPGVAGLPLDGQRAE